MMPGKRFKQGFLWHPSFWAPFILRADNVYKNRIEIIRLSNYNYMTIMLQKRTTCGLAHGF